MSRDYQVGDIYINEPEGLENSFQVGSLFFGATALTAVSQNNWFYDARTGGWFRDEFADTDHGPISLVVFDGDEPDDRVILIGSEEMETGLLSLKNMKSGEQQKLPAEQIIATLSF